MNNNMLYKVMLVDDSAVIRGLFNRWLEEDGAIKVVAYAANGIQALKELTRHDIDVIVLDIEMPEMDGMQTLPRILRARPDIKVIMAGTPSHQQAEISLKALESGAADYILKPANNKELQSDRVFRRELIEKIKALAAARRRKQGIESAHKTFPPSRSENYTATHRASRLSDTLRSNTTTPPTSPAISDRLYSDKSITLRTPGRARPEILAIGSSTGGPQALFTLFSALQGLLTVPVVITQHMPADFTSILTEHLSRVTKGICKEGEDGEELVAGNIYLAPGDHHMLITRRGPRMVIKITRDPPENFCRPAVDPMMRSLKTAYNDRVLAVILTGMGQDGLKGCRELADAGSTILAQDEASSVVWGMPGAVATNGLCSAILPLDKIGPVIAKILKGGHL
jgi:two-component system, chemotaxis family, protein-glutamate methylesterase/glutaminase